MRVRDDLVGTMMLQWDVDSRLFWMHSSFKAWKGEKERLDLARSHGEVLGTTLLQWGLHGDEMVVRITLQVWHKHCRDLATVADARKYGIVLGKALLHWDSDNDATFRRGVFIAWSTSWRARALLHNKALEHKKVLNQALSHWAMENECMLLEAYLRAWSYATTGESLTRRHGQALGKALLRWSSENEALLLQAALSAWAEETTKRKAARKSASVTGKTLLAWDQECKGLVMQGVVRVWSLMLHSERGYEEMLEKALATWNEDSIEILMHVILHAWRAETSKQALSRDHGDIIGKALLRWDDDNVAHLMQASLHAWRHLAQVAGVVRAEHGVLDRALLCWSVSNDQSRLRAVLSAWSIVLCRLASRRQDSESFQKASWRWAEGCARLCLQTAVSCWRAEAAAAHTDRLHSHALASSWWHADNLAGAALQCWGNVDRQLLGQTVLRWWSAEVAAEREASEKMLREAELAQLGARARMNASMCVDALASEASTFLILMPMRAWQAEAVRTREEKRAETMSRLASVAERVRGLHDGQVRKLAHHVAAAFSSASLRCTLAAWLAVAKRAAQEEATSAARGIHRARITIMLGKAEESTLRMFVLHLWSNATMQEREVTSRLAQLEEHKTVDEARRAQMEFLLQGLDVERGAATQREVLLHWHCEAAKATEDSHRDDADERVGKLAALRTEAAIALGVSRSKCATQELLHRWRAYVLAETARTEGEALSEEKHHSLVLLLLAREQHAMESDYNCKAHYALTDKLAGHNEQHDALLHALEEEVEMLRAQMESARLKVQECHEVEESANALREHCKLQEAQLIDLERELEMLHAHMRGSFGPPVALKVGMA